MVRMCTTTYARDVNVRDVTVMSLKITEDRTGDRIHERRLLLRMSLRQVADLAGISHTTLSRIESGRTAASNRFVLAAIAAALKTSPADLAGTVVPDGPDRPAALAGVYDALAAIFDADLEYAPVVHGEIAPWSVLSTQLGKLIALRQACSYRQLNQMAPALIAQLYEATTGPDRNAALAALARVAEAVSFSVRYSGDVHAAVVASDRSWQAAQNIDDPVMRSFGAWARAHSALGCGRHDRTVQITDKAIAELDSAGQAAGRLEMLGMLYLTNAFAHAGAGRLAQTVAPLAEAETLAAQTGETDTLALMFGPTNVALWKIAIMTDAGDPNDAIPLIGSTDPRVIPSPSRQSCFYLDAARALHRVGQDGRAVVMAETAHRIAPERVAGDPLAVELVRGLVDGTRRRAVDGRLRGLAARIGVPA